MLTGKIRRREAEEAGDVMTRLGQKLRQGALSLLLKFTLVFLALVSPALAAPYAAMVMDARSGEVLHSRNADTRLHPASLTKMMTLYVVFEAVERGEISLDTQVRISARAAAEPPSKLGLSAGQSIRLRYLIRAAAVKSANDAATALAEAIEGSEAAFARRMNRTARALGMSRSTFRNAHGLTEDGHLSTARDMTLLGRHLFYDYPQYYNLFSRRTTDAGIRQVSNTNRRLLGAYRGADGIKTGYTRAAGFNLVASAERGSERVIATVFGGRSSATRNARVAELLDLGFQRAPTRVALRPPSRPAYGGSGNAGNTQTAVAVSLLPVLRPAGLGAPAPSDALMSALEAEIQNAVEQAQEAIENGEISSNLAVETEAEAEADTAVGDVAANTESAVAQPQTQADPASQVQTVRDESLDTSDGSENAAVVLAALTPAPISETPAITAPLIIPEPRREITDPVVVTRISTSGGRDWGVSIGKYGSRFEAERMLLRTALAESSTLDGTLRRVRNGSDGFEARFVGLTEEAADMACRRLVARARECSVVNP